MWWVGHLSEQPSVSVSVSCCLLSVRKFRLHSLLFIRVYPLHASQLEVFHKYRTLLSQPSPPINLPSTFANHHQHPSTLPSPSSPSPPPPPPPPPSSSSVSFFPFYHFLFFCFSCSFHSSIFFCFFLLFFCFSLTGLQNRLGGSHQYSPGADAPLTVWARKPANRA